MRAVVDAWRRSPTLQQDFGAAILLREAGGNNRDAFGGIAGPARSALSYEPRRTGVLPTRRSAETIELDLDTARRLPAVEEMGAELSDSCRRTGRENFERKRQECGSHGTQVADHGRRNFIPGVWRSVSPEQPSFSDSADR